MKHFNLTCLILAALSMTIACKKTKVAGSSSSSSSQAGTWVSRANFPGVAIGESATFTVNNVAYVGTGTNPATPNQKVTVMYKYTPATPASTKTANSWDSAYGVWTQVQSFPGQARSNAVGFSISNTGYLGSGLANDGATALADFYAYNPGANTWSPIDSLHNDTSSFARYDAVAFSFDTTAYVLTGTNSFYYFGDVWRYSPSANTWIREINYPGSPRSGAVSFVYNGQGYIVTGYTSGDKWAQGNLAYDFWRFTPGNDTSVNAWARLNDIYNTNTASFDNNYTDIIRDHATAFTILGQITGDKGYITLGSNNGTDITSTWEYDFATDRWTAQTPFNGAPRSGAVGFSLAGTVPSTIGQASTRGFVVSGLNQGFSAAFSDCEEFFPNPADSL
jgi:N-acetylneuraminic acid mutarotase